MLFANVVCLDCVAASQRQPEAAWSKSFNGVTAKFKIGTPIIRIDEPLKVTAVYRNEGRQSVTFRILPLILDVHVYQNGRKVPFESPFFSVEQPYSEITLAPGETTRVEDDLYVGARFQLVPGKDATIWFCYFLPLLPDKAMEKLYERKYRVVNHAVAWENHGHTFKVIK
ncbi:MAG: hypothetical protein DLM73_01665 [Chthoniobacterales bacterium]|nr:MAG: hypothetical protein DLM73_01665 [Chthoniobacterales bacterium]